MKKVQRQVLLFMGVFLLILEEASADEDWCASSFGNDCVSCAPQQKQTDWEEWCSGWEFSLAFLSLKGGETPPSPVFLSERMSQGSVPKQLSAVGLWTIEGVRGNIIVPLRERFQYECSCLWLLPWTEDSQSVWKDREDQYLIDVALNTLPHSTMFFGAVKYDLNCFLYRMDHRIWRKSCSLNVPVVIMPFLGVSVLHVTKTSTAQGKVISTRAKDENDMFFDRQNFWGLGPSLGLRSECTFFSLCTLFGEGGVTLFFGRKQASQRALLALFAEAGGSGDGGCVAPALHTNIGLQVLISGLIPIDVLAEASWESYLYSGVFVYELPRIVSVGKGTAKPVQSVSISNSQIINFSTQGVAFSLGVAF